jgi:hypothetical protein
VEGDYHIEFKEHFEKFALSFAGALRDYFALLIKEG